MNTISAWSASIATAVTLFGCASSRPVPELSLDGPALSALAGEYRTSFRVHDEHAATTRNVSWRIWREPTRVVTENLTARTGEVWERDGATLFHEKVFHEDRKSVAYQMDDLKLSGDQSTSLARQFLLVDPQLLTHLKEVRSGWREGYPFKQFRGAFEGQQWDITIRTDLDIATRVQRRSAELTETTEAVSLHALSAAPWEPTPRESYEVIEFADFGDRLHVPFVAKVQAQLGAPHTH
jgi:hypothetical protein